jgi:HAD superfamily hydrolase (TIGR01509 family)
VFDCDGLLLETESRWTIAEEVLCDRWGVAFSMELKRRLLGTHLDRSGEILAEWFRKPAEEAPAMADELIGAYRDAIDEHGVEPMPGALELVTGLAGQLPIAVASNTNIDDTRRVLARSALPDEVFAAVVCAGGPITPKPAPDVYLAACAALDCDPSRTVAFEDSPVGAQAAAAAGLVVVGVPSTPGVVLDAHVVIGSLARVDPARLRHGTIG